MPQEPISNKFQSRIGNFNNLLRITCRSAKNVTIINGPFLSQNLERSFIPKVVYFLVLSRHLFGSFIILPSLRLKPRAGMIGIFEADA